MPPALAELTARDWIEVAIAVGTALLAIATFFLAVYSRRSAAEGARALELLEKQTTALIGQAAAVEKQAKAAEDASGAMEREAGIADAALKEAMNQTQLALASNAEARKLRYFSAVPLLGLEFDSESSSSSDELFALFKVTNRGAQPALAVRVVIYGETAERTPHDVEAAHSRVIPELGIGEQRGLQVRMTDVRHMGTTPRPGFRDRYSYDWMRVSMSYRGLLGAQLVQHYEWGANLEMGKYGFWSLREVEIQADPENPADVVRIKSN